MSNSKYIKIDGITLCKLGNKKIGQDTLIFNMQSAHDCYCDKMGLCQFGQNGNKKCYALRNEKLYKNTLPYRQNQQKWWELNSSSKIIKALDKIINKYPQIKYIRFNESGDMKNTYDLVKLVNIAKAFPDQIIYTYTHNKPLYETNKHVTLPDNLIINGSGFKWTNNYDSVDKIDLEFASKNLICKGNCRHCNLCKTNHGQNIYEEVF